MSRMVTVIVQISWLTSFIGHTRLCFVEDPTTNFENPISNSKTGLTTDLPVFFPSQVPKLQTTSSNCTLRRRKILQPTAIRPRFSHVTIAPSRLANRPRSSCSVAIEWRVAVMINHLCSVSVKKAPRGSLLRYSQRLQSGHGQRG